jgi:hypothetical protein
LPEDNCPLLWILDRLKTGHNLKISCETCLVNRQFCEAFRKGDKRAIDYALILGDIIQNGLIGGDVLGKSLRCKVGQTK